MECVLLSAQFCFADNPMALYNVATHYFSGLGVPQNLGKAKEYYEKAAILGFYPAQVREHWELHNHCVY